MRPFPRISEAVKTRYGLGDTDLALRPFGRHERDLNVDFTRGPRPVLVTELLECCASAAGGGVDRDLLWEMPIGRRIEGLLAVLPSDGDSDILVEFRCGSAVCAVESEFTIAVDEIAALQDEAYASDRIVVPLPAGTAVALRRPTGRDQLDWLNAGFEDEAAVTRAMLDALIDDGHERGAIEDAVLSNEVIDRIEKAMEESDPLISFGVMAACPACGAENEIKVDLEDLALRRLHGAQQALLASVHRLAYHYHWNEREILATPHWRRDHYLRLIGTDAR